MKKKIALLMACVMAFGVAVGGTLAWLTATDDPVTNVFTPSDINIELTETFNKDTDGNDVADAWEKKMVPGDILSKDPKVTVKAGSEACWLFVKVEKSENFDTYLTSAIADGWTALGDTYPGVYYREIEDLSGGSASDKEFYVLKDNQVTVNSGVTKEQMNALNADNQPKLTFSAYAIQSAHLKNADKSDADTALEAWALINA